MGTLWWLKVPLRFKELRRLKQILGVLGRHGFQDVSLRLSGFKGLRWLASKKDEKKLARIPVESRIRMVLEELGPTFIKLGQVMATRPDILPMSMIQELEKLQDHVPPVPFEDVKRVIETDLKLPINKIFQTIVAEPIAAASIAQVHRAVLLDGTEVVVKVQRPNAEALVKADMRLLKILATALEDRVPEIRRYKPGELIQEFSDTISEEMDFLGEKENLERYRENFKDEEKLHIPATFPKFCSRRVLVMEEMHGTKVTEVETLKSKGVDLKEVLDTGMRVTLRSIFEFGFFHADPHPGNFFVEDDGTIVLIDFGMMGVIDDARINDMTSFMVAMVTGDTDAMVNLLLELDLIPDSTDIRRLRIDIGRLLVRYKNTNIGNIDTGQFLNRIYEVMGRHNVSLPTDLMMMGKAIATLEGIGRTIFPDFSPVEYIKPYLTKVYSERILDPNRQAAYVYNTLKDMVGLLKDAPYDVRRVIRKLRKGEIKLNLESRALDRLTRSKAVHSNRLLYGLMTLGFGGLSMYANTIWGTGVAVYTGFALSAGFFILLLTSLVFKD